ncbi:MAG: ParB/RepB/Spo0J family partition protein [Desulfobulbaceae bacterium]|nr:ParB/RepB/Spo0J family partition protein [Desulfobulbaceae bacterium]
MAITKPSLGRGLMSLLPAEGENSGSSMNQPQVKIDASPYFICPIAFIQANPYQPRKVFNPEELESLASSIKEKGILQPLVVRKIDNNQYELIAGERRLRAAQQAGLEKVPVLVKDIAISDRLELALIENIQRENLNPLEEAEAYAQLIEEFSLTQEMVSKRVGKNRSTVANSLRILQLPDYAKESVNTGILSAGHARVLLSINDEGLVRSLHDTIVAQSLSVREAELLAKKMKAPAKERPHSKRPEPILPAPYCLTITKTLSDYFGAKSAIVQHGNKGKIEIEYTSPEELERLLSLMIQEV